MDEKIILQMEDNVGQLPLTERLLYTKNISNRVVAARNDGPFSTGPFLRMFDRIDTVVQQLVIDSLLRNETTSPVGNH